MKKILATLLAITMILTVISVPVFAEYTQDDFDTAVSAAAEGTTVEVQSGTFKLKGIPRNITIKAAEGATVAFDCAGTGSICEVSNGATFEDVTFNMGTASYHGFQHAGKIIMNNCIINGLFFSYGDMEFNNCTFNAPGKEYSMWCYAGDITYNSCTLNGQGKWLNIYNENNTSVPWKITVNNCKFVNTGDANKAALNVKYHSKGEVGLKFDVKVDDKTTYTGNAPTPSTSDSKIVFNSIVQLDDIKPQYTADITITHAGKQLYPEAAKAVAKIGSTEYATLQEALAAAKAKDIITLIDDITLDELVTINKSDITIDGNGYKISADNDKADWAVYKVGGSNQKFGSVNLFAVTGSNVTIKNLTVDIKDYRGMSCITTKGGSNVLYENNTYIGRGSGHYYGYANNGTVTFKDCVIKTQGYAIHMANEGTTGDKLVIDNCELYGWSSFGTCESVKAKDSYFGLAEDTGKNGNLAIFRPYCPTTLTNCTFCKEYTMCTGDEGDYVLVGLGTGAPITVVLKNCHVEGEEAELTDIVTANAFDNEPAYLGSVFAFNPIGDAINGYRGGIFVAQDSTKINVAPDCELKEIKKDVYEIEGIPEIIIDPEETEKAEMKDDKGQDIDEGDKEEVVKTVTENNAVNGFTDTGVPAVVEANKNEIKELLKEEAKIQGLDVDDQIEGKVSLDNTLYVYLKTAVISKTDDGKVLSNNMTFDVTPVVSVTVIDGQQGTKTITTELHEMGAPVKFRLPVSSLFAAGKPAKVFHNGQPFCNALVQTEDGENFIEVITNEFSEFSYMIENSLKWEYNSDSGIYGAEGEKNGVVRLLFDSGIADEYISKSKVVFFNADSFEDAKLSPWYVEDSIGLAGAFSADLFNLDKTNFSPIYGFGYIEASAGDETVQLWSGLNTCEPKFTKDLGEDFK